MKGRESGSENRCREGRIDEKKGRKEGDVSKGEKEREIEGREGDGREKEDRRRGWRRKRGEME